jgi:hypothetical protein
MDLRGIKMVVSNEGFHEAFEAFEKKLYNLANDIPEFGWVRHDRAVYNHKRVREYSLWYIAGGQEFGHIFLARQNNWDGQVNYDRVLEIIQDHNLAIGPFEDSRVWDLANLKNQEKPEPRCQICGKITSE